MMIISAPLFVNALSTSSISFDLPNIGDWRSFDSRESIYMLEGTNAGN